MDGDSARSEDLVAHGEFLRALARGLVGDRHLAEDVVQEARLTALSRAPRSSGARRAWLARVVGNLARDTRRRDAGRRAREERAARPEAVPSHVAVGERLAVQRRVLRAVEALPASQRTVVFLRFYEGLPPRKIAARLELPVETVKTRLQRALARLREKLDDECGGRAAWLPLLVPDIRTGLVPTGVATSVGLLGGTIVANKLAVATAVVLVVVVAWAAWPETERLAPPAGTSAESAMPLAGREAREAVSPDEPAMNARVAVVVAEEPAGAKRPLAGVLVDESTAEPVPHYALLLRDDEGGMELLTSRADGSFTSTAAYDPGFLQVTAVDHPRLEPREEQTLTVPHHAEDGPWNEAPLEVRVGPTYHLRLDLPPGTTVDDFEGHLEPSHRGPVFGTVVAPLRGEDGTWVRFAPEASHLAGLAPWRLTVRSHAGYWQGMATVPTNAGILRGPIPIELRHAGRLLGRVVDGEGQPVNPSCPIRVNLLKPVGNVRASYGVWAEKPTWSFDVPYVESGLYEVRLDSPRYAFYSAEVEIRAGETTTLDVVLEKRPDLGIIRGRLTSRTGGYRFQGDVVSIRNTTEWSTYFVSTPEVEEVDGRVEATFVFRDVPPGEYEVVMRSDTQYEWSPADLVVRPDQPEFEIVVHDDVTARDYAFRAEDARTGESLLHFSVSLRLVKDGDEQSITDMRPAAGLIRFPDVPVHLPASWMLAAEGYAPVWGDGTDFADVDPGEARTVALAPGWGAEFHVLELDNRPVSGAHIVLDGTDYGATDAGGVLRVILGARPARAEVRHPDLIVKTGTLDQETGAIGSIGGRVFVFLGPPD